MLTAENQPKRRLSVSSTAPDRDDWVPAGLNLMTLVVIRWVASVGQAAAILIVGYLLKYNLPLVACAAAIALLAGSNLYVGSHRRRRNWLTVRRATWILGFDIVQLGILLGLTGGLVNPFAVLLLAPVAVSATILSRRATLVLSELCFLTITMLAFLHFPLPWGPDGIRLPVIYTLGSWTALCVALVFVGAYVWTASDDARRLSSALAQSEADLAREREMSSLGALAAAAAHELGSPLATIAVVAKELSRQVPKDSPFAEDIDLLTSQSDRCREILHGLENRRDADGGAPYHRLLLSALVEAAAEDHVPDEIAFDIVVDPESVGPEPELIRSPEFLNGIGNFLSNAGQFARSLVEVRIRWDDETVELVIADDGPGFSNSVLKSAGEPYISTRAGVDGHMGLGIFIATTLLERLGAQLSFSNADGAVVSVQWSRAEIDAATAQNDPAKGGIPADLG